MKKTDMKSVLLEMFDKHSNKWFSKKDFVKYITRNYGTKWKPGAIERCVRLLRNEGYVEKRQEGRIHMWKIVDGPLKPIKDKAPNKLRKDGEAGKHCMSNCDIRFRYLPDKKVFKVEGYGEDFKLFLGTHDRLWDDRKYKFTKNVIGILKTAKKYKEAEDEKLKLK